MDSKQPIKSAKDAINAMYANGTSLGDFLGNTSGDRPEPAKDKSAASLHHGNKSKRLESVRPSASAIFRRAESRPPAKPQSVEGSVDPLSKSPEVAVTKAAAAKIAATPAKKSVVAPVVRTSLKLGPKRPPVVAPAKSSRAAAPSLEAARLAAIRPAKGKIQVSDPAPKDPISTIKDAASAVLGTKEPARRVASTPSSTRMASAHATPAKPAASTRAASNKPAARPPHPAGSRVIQDVVRPGQSPKSHAAKSTPAQPAKPVAAKPQPRAAEPATRPRPPFSISTSESTQSETSSRTTKNPLASVMRKPAPSGARPLDSVKNRFRPAPKGYASNSAEEAEQGRPYRAEDFLNPNHPARMRAVEEQSGDTGVHIYGMMDGPETSYSDIPSWARREGNNDSDGLGVIEDYHRTDGPAVHIPAATIPAESLAISGAAADASDPVEPEPKPKNPDNNRYVLGARSPFFLNSVNVEKRPLSPSKKAPELENPVYAGQKLDESEDKKGNVYEKKQKPAKTKKLPPKKDSAPVVIIPPRRKSRGSLFILLLITVILGAALGALVYLCFFQ